MDLTELPAEVDVDDPLARLRARGRPQLRSILRALHEAAAGTLRHRGRAGDARFFRASYAVHHSALITCLERQPVRRVGLGRGIR